jgi:hypothetical protein
MPLSAVVVFAVLFLIDQKSSIFLNKLSKKLRLQPKKGYI